jgi:uncharacterized membrane protein
VSDGKFIGGVGGKGLEAIAAETGNPLLMVLAAAADRLFYGRDFGDEYMSPFGAVLVIAAFQETNGVDVRPGAAAMFNQNTHLDWPARAALITQLKEVLADLERIEATSRQVPT